MKTGPTCASFILPPENCLGGGGECVDKLESDLFQLEKGIGTTFAKNTTLKTCPREQRKGINFTSPPILLGDAGDLAHGYGLELSAECSHPHRS